MLRALSQAALESSSTGSLSSLSTVSWIDEEGTESEDEKIGRALVEGLLPDGLVFRISARYIFSFHSSEKKG